MFKATIDGLLSTGLKPNEIALIGFSQGACLAAEVAARSPYPLGALIALTGGRIGQQPVALSNPAPLNGMSALLTTGKPDSHVPVSRVEETAAHFRDRGADVELRIFPGRPHTVSREEIELSRTILRRKI